MKMSLSYEVYYFQKKIILLSDQVLNLKSSPIVYYSVVFDSSSEKNSLLLSNFLFAFLAAAS